jgi:pyruvyl transferase EpsO
MRLAEHRVLAGREILSRGSVVVTNRLHAHILCRLLGIPHVVMDNNYGKLSSYAETWETLGPTARWADSAEEAIEISREMKVKSPVGG